MNLIVSPMNFSLITKAFTRNKGAEIVLSPEEILANKEQAPMMEGKGIFGSKFDAGVEKAIGRKGKKKVYGFAKDVLNPIAKTALYAGIATGATALSAAQPELIPIIAPVAAGTADFLSDYLDKPSDFYSKPTNAGGPRAREARNLGKKYLQQQALNQVNAQLGTNMGYMNQAGIGQAIQNQASQSLNAGAIKAQEALMNRLATGMENPNTLSAEEKALLKGTPYEYMIGRGLYPQGRGLYVGSARGGAIVGLNGGMVHTTPQALQSQPMASNFQFRYTLPVVIQQAIR